MQSRLNGRILSWRKFTTSGGFDKYAEHFGDVFSEFLVIYRSFQRRALAAKRRIMIDQ